MTLKEWVINSLEQIIRYERVLVCDPLGIAKEAYVSIDALANQHGFTVIQASTNLTFRDSYERLLQDPEVGKIMILDQTPYIRLHNRSISSAPPLFYTDFLEKCPLEARISLDLQQYLRDVTGDGNRPQACNEVRFARLMI
ncbi:MAG: PglZ domain-containing protein, partial [Syntrophomonadaceae bacterium]|nr:PglZ domain-containing protein [Syntrophomonadaceae bacterium]